LFDVDAGSDQDGLYLKPGIALAGKQNRGGNRVGGGGRYKQVEAER
jgi:hypothetical protein